MSGTPEKPEASAGKRTRLHDIADSNTQIASKLKVLYSSVEQEPIPDMFLELLEKLDRAEQIGKSEI